jgi:5-methyltetrahydrofolate--homocysteine methyltransferase
MELQKIYQNVLEGNVSEVKTGVQAALSQGLDADMLLNKSLIAAMEEVGKRFEEGDFFVPEMLVAARAMQAGLVLLKPQLADSGANATDRVAIGTVKGDLHDIGKNLVAMMWEGAGFEVIDLGTDVDPQEFVNVAQDGVTVIGMSALLTTTMINMRTTIQALHSAGLRNKVKVVIGGAPVTDVFAKSIGADAFAPDASSAVRIVRKLLG